MTLSHFLISLNNHEISHQATFLTIIDSKLIVFEPIFIPPWEVGH
jgi:hypothetical protein